MKEEKTLGQEIKERICYTKARQKASEILINRPAKEFAEIVKKKYDLEIKRWDLQSK